MAPVRSQRRAEGSALTLTMTCQKPADCFRHLGWLFFVRPMTRRCDSADFCFRKNLMPTGELIRLKGRVLHAPHDEHRPAAQLSGPRQQTGIEGA